MARPVKWRRVEFIPEENTYFVPCSKTSCDNNYELEETKLKVEELEAMRLKDLEGLTQAAAAERMHISRQTFQNIIARARRKAVLALVEGKALSIEGGHYTRTICSLVCPACGNSYEIPFEREDMVCRSCGFRGGDCSKSDECERKCKKI